MFPSRAARWRIRSALDPACRSAFLRELPEGAALLDVGCGNRTASVVKSVRSDLRYFGLDIGDYNIGDADKELMDAYLIRPPEQFAEGILDFGRTFDAVLSSHNLEHCDDPDAVLAAMLSVVRPGGRIFLAFPSHASTTFPSRDGCLNFHDDPTHRTLLPFDALLGKLESREFEILRAVPRSRGRLRGAWALGALVEPWSRLAGRVLPFTWYFWGFESVIWARRRVSSNGAPG